MSLQVFRSSRSLCSSCAGSRRVRAYYSQSALSSAASEVSTPATRSVPQHAIANARNPLAPTRLDRYLASIRAADLEPTLDDLERCRPEGFSRPDSSRYAEEYTNLLETLRRSFSKDQLRHFTELYKLDSIWTRSSRRKTEYAESIIEKAWGWPSLKEIERKRRDATEVLVKSFPVTPNQLFLIMGKDGADLLQLSMRYSVHVSLTSEPLALRVEGLRGSLKGVAEYISSLKKGIIDKVFELPTGRPIRQDLLQRISRLAGAYVENHGNKGKVRICAKDLSDIAAAERLALRASLEVGTQARTVCYESPSKTRGFPIEPSEPHRYSIYPFVTPCLFPWMMHPGGAFRLRRVTDWLGAGFEDVTSTGLSENPHRVLNLDGSWQELCQLVGSTMPESTSQRKRIITASLGHILISGDNPQRATIYPPLRSTLSLPDILKWVQTSGAPLTFVPSGRPAIMTVTADKRSVLHRLIYKTLPQTVVQASTLPQQVLKFEVELPGAPSVDTKSTQDAPKLSSSEVNSSADSLPSQGDTSQLNNLPETLNNGWDSSCQVGRERYINLMLPDRPMDVQFCIFNWDDITLVQQPRALQEYVNKLHVLSASNDQLSQLDPPSTITFEENMYYLHQSSTLKQSSDPILLYTASSDHAADNLVEVWNESIVDLQSTQKMEVCQVKFDGVIEGPDWKRFLAACDQLSTMPSWNKIDKKDHIEEQCLRSSRTGYAIS